MSEESSQPQSSEEPLPPGPVGLYDFLYYLSKSFGRLLPLVVILLLLAVGAWYFIRELSQLQTKLIQSERDLSAAQAKQKDAEFKAQSAASDERNKLLVEQSSRLSELNDRSAGVSKKIQELVSGQLKNMQDIESQSSAQREKQSQEFKLLREQVTELENRRKALDKGIAVAPYLSVRPQLIEAVQSSGFRYTGRALVGILREQAKVAEVRAQIDQDLKNKSLDYRFRALLLLELFRTDSSHDHIDNLASVISDNKALIDASFADLFNEYQLFSDAQATVVSPLFIASITTETYDSETRARFVESLQKASGSRSDLIYKKLPNDDKIRLVRTIGSLMMKPESKFSSCYDPIGVMKAISLDAADAYAYVYLDSNPSDKIFADCLKTMLRGPDDVSRPRPKDDVVHIWLPPK